MRSFLPALLLAFALLLAPAGADEPEPESCRVCGMYLERFRKTVARVEYRDGTSESFCGVACAIRDINSRGGLGEVEAAEVTPWETRERKPLDQATFVIGSRLIPDMLPNIIAFESEEAAARFVAEQGGRITPLDELLENTSYRGLTAPFRIPTAAVPGAGVLNLNATYSGRSMDGLLRGSGSVTQRQGLATQPRVPSLMKTTLASVQVGYGATDDLFVALNVPELWKYQESVMANGRTRTAYRNGVGDASLVARWRLWRDDDFDDHFSLYGAVTLPTGVYDPVLRDSSAMQLGTGTVSFTPGLLYSKHFDDFWFHAAATYTLTGTNAHQYRFGPMARGGVALHWVPNYKDLVGLELDFEAVEANRYRGVPVPSTGRTAGYYSLVYQRQLVLVGGGNMNVNLLYGGPLFQRVNDLQLGESAHWSAGLQWQRRF